METRNDIRHLSHAAFVKLEIVGFLYDVCWNSDLSWSKSDRTTRGTSVGERILDIVICKLAWILVGIYEDQAFMTIFIYSCCKLACQGVEMNEGERERETP